MTTAAFIGTCESHQTKRRKTSTTTRPSKLQIVSGMVVAFLQEPIAGYFTASSATEFQTALASFEALSRKIKLKSPLVIKVGRDSGCWYCQCDKLGLSSTGATEKEAKEGLLEEFVMTWDGLRNEPNESLTVDAQLLRNRFVALIANA